MAGSLRLFRLAGIRVTVDPSWFLIFLLVAWSLAVGYLPRQMPGAGTASLWLTALVLAALLFASVLAHEFSHALVARRQNLEVEEIMLFVFGGVAKLEGEPREARSEFLISVAGPAMSIGLGLGILWIARVLDPIASDAVYAGLRWLGLINVALAVFNLVPGFPLDGGRILRAILWWRMGDFERSTVAAARVGQTFAGLLIAAGVFLALTTGGFGWLWEVIIGWFLWTAASRSVQLARLRTAVAGVSLRELTSDRVPALRADHDVRVGLAQASALSAVSELAVVEPDGRLAGVVTLEALMDTASTDPHRPVRDVARPAAEGQVLDIETPPDRLVDRLAGMRGRLPLVVDGEKLLGTVDPRALVSTLKSEP
jgi:Zn-dependent protease